MMETGTTCVSVGLVSEDSGESLLMGHNMQLATDLLMAPIFSLEELSLLVLLAIVVVVVDVVICPVAVLCSAVWRTGCGDTSSGNT